MITSYKTHTDRGERRKRKKGRERRIWRRGRKRGRGRRKWRRGMEEGGGEGRG